MRIITGALLLSSLLVAPACKRVTLQYEGDDPFQITVPMMAIFKAMKWTQDDVLEIDDLAGVDKEIPLQALAEAIHLGGDAIKVSFKQGETRISGEKKGKVFHIHLDDAEEETQVTLRLPEGLVMALLEGKNGVVSEKRVKRSLKRFSGVLLEVHSPEEQVRIVLR